MLTISIENEKIFELKRDKKDKAEITIKHWRINPDLFLEREYKKGYTCGFTIYFEFDKKKTLGEISEIVKRADYYIFLTSNEDVKCKEYKKTKKSKYDDKFFEKIYLFKKEENCEFIYTNINKILKNAIYSSQNFKKLI